MMFHFNYFKKILIFLAIFAAYVNMPILVNAQVITPRQLNQLSLTDLYILRNEQRRQARIVFRNCYNTYIWSTCNAERLKYDQYFVQLNNYIAQREIRGK